MANLSNLLGDVYGDGNDSDESPDESAAAPEDAAAPSDPSAHESPEGEEEPESSEAPDWASDDRLDAAFGDWTAGTLPGAEPDQREDLDHLGEAPVTEAAEATTPAEPAPQVRAIAAGELERPPAREPRPPSDDVTVRDFTSVAPAPTPEAPPAAKQVPDTRWHRDDDDILPGGGRRGLRGLLSR